MWSKFFRIPVLLLFLAITYYGCVEEPTIDPVKRPYTLLRVANFSYNVDTLIVSIDAGEVSAKVFNLYKNELPSQYFEIQSGKRHFLIKNPAGDTLYNDKINVGSFEELSLFFTGYAEPGNDLLNSFGPATYSNGMVYLYEGMGNDTTVIRSGIFTPYTPLDTAIYLKFGIQITDTTTKNIVQDTSLSFNSFGGAALTGNKTYKVGIAGITGLEVKTNLTDTLFTLESGYEYFVYAVGRSNKPYFIIEKVTPLPIRSK